MRNRAQISGHRTSMKEANGWTFSKRFSRIRICFSIIFWFSWAAFIPPIFRRVFLIFALTIDICSSNSSFVFFSCCTSPANKAVNCRHERGCIELNQNPAWANLDGATSMQNCEGGLSNYSFKVLKFAYLGLAAKSICFVKTQRAASVWSHGTLSSNTRYLAVVCQVISLALKQSLLMSSHIATFIQKYNGYLDRCFTVHWL